MRWINQTSVLWVMMLVLITTTGIDMYTAFSSPIFDIAETNPIFLFIGTKTLVVLTVLITFFLFYKLKTLLSLPMLYTFSLLILYSSMLHLVGAMTNISATSAYLADPEMFVQAIESVSDTQKVQSYMIIVSFGLVPYLLAVIAFYVSYYLFLQRKGNRDKIILEIKDKIKRL